MTNDGQAHPAQGNDLKSDSMDVTVVTFVSVVRRIGWIKCAS